jgi:hypothetical protein
MLEEKVRERDKRPDIDLFLILLLTMYINIYIYRCMHTYILVLGDFFLTARTKSNGKDRKKTY